MFGAIYAAIAVSAISAVDADVRQRRAAVEAAEIRREYTTRSAESLMHKQRSLIKWQCAWCRTWQVDHKCQSCGAPKE